MSEYDELLNQNEVLKDTLDVDKSTLLGPRPFVKISSIKRQNKLKLALKQSRTQPGALSHWS